MLEKMKDDDELEMLLNEIPHATSSFNPHHHTLSNAHHHNNNSTVVLDHGYNGQASCLMTHKLNGHHGHGHGHGLYDDDKYGHGKFAYASSPVSGCSSKSDLSGGGFSLSETGSSFDSDNRFRWDFKKVHGSSSVDDSSLSKEFCNMYIGGARGGVSRNTGVQSHDQSVNGDVEMSFEKYKAFEKYRQCFPDYGGRDRSVFPERPIIYAEELGSEWLQHTRGIANIPSEYDRLFARSTFSNSGLSSQFYRDNLLENNNFQMGRGISDVPRSLYRPMFDDSQFYDSPNGMNLFATGNALYQPNLVQFPRLMSCYDEENLLHYQPLVPNGRNKAPFHVRMPLGRVESCSNEDSLIIQGEGTNYRMNNTHFRGLSAAFYHENGARKSQVDGRRSPKMYDPFSMPPKFSSLEKARGCIYQIAKDQNGCRFLQRMFDEGTSLDVETIFNELIDNVVELMINPFGNYLMQKLLEVCNEDQRLKILLMVTKEPGELVRISLNTHGTRVVQKLIETIKTRQQISLVISALEPGFLALIKDLNGNHVVQRCLQCFTNEDSKFIFVAAAKYCVDIATHQHGCCVLQRCISHSTGEHRQNFVAEISSNGLLLAQDAYGNYVVQFILELKIPSATSKLTSQFEGNYVHLSTQKFSSHVVEKCLRLCSDKTRSKIIQELLSATYFERLLQDPHANYVVQTALRVSQGPLHDSLVHAIESYKVISRNSPYSKRIFSHKLLKG